MSAIRSDDKLLTANNSSQDLYCSYECSQGFALPSKTNFTFFVLKTREIRAQLLNGPTHPPARFISKK